MKIVYITEGKHKSLLKDLVLKRDNLQTKMAYQKISGNNNYILTFSCGGSVVACAKVLSEITEDVNKIFCQNKIKHYLITDEASNTFAYRLYPLICQFETKLRRLVYVALFDLDDDAKKLVIQKIKDSANKELLKVTDIPEYDFLEKMTMSHLFNFLFGNSDFMSNAKIEINKIAGDDKRTVTKRELIDKLLAMEEKTVWSELFSKSFYPLDLPSVFKEVFDYRNDTMHFHFIPYKVYRKAYNTLTKTIKALDLQIEKDVVLENTPENVDIISNSPQFYFQALEKSLKMTLDSINAVLNQFDPQKILAQLNIFKLFNPDIYKISQLPYSDIGLNNDSDNITSSNDKNLPAKNEGENKSEDGDK